ncbi:flagellar M-ring protein FliF [Yoonia maricola]|uniref:Flagellar M-ring protein n=1 Tax=Yoonia maricola TaxID=420999 RepID=A0A2M8W597_9RHOB|nr:flagellar basal-body MS-ring/collar protein FliF [Yoonia maricola]PJI86107.1 flagellar M-ring protein FliF [Yoonia maricola]
MENFATAWSALSMQRRIIVIFVTGAVFVAILLLARGAGTKDMSLLFGGLEPRAAGDVVTALDQQGVAYEVRGNAIYVPTVQRDVLRMALAGQGLPATGSQGYELLDSLSGFSTTAQMFDAAYWRAKEGELARTIVASPHIRGARVHISTPSNRPFRPEQTQTAAVTVTTTDGTLSAQHLRALQFLISAAVPGLSPGDVAVIDDAGGLLSESDTGQPSITGDDHAENLRQRAERLLAARVGVGNAVVEVSVDQVTETEMITERRVDPDSRIAISTDVTESSGNSTDSRGGDVTVASNLPEGDAGANTGSASNENSESRTLTNYEVSQTERQLTKAPGAIKRLTVAVLVNDMVETAADGTTTTTPRTAEELAALEELVASAVGLDTDRGDVLTLRSMPFEPFELAGTTIAGPVTALPLDMMQLIQIGVLAAVALILGLFVVRPILVSGNSGAAALSIEDQAEPIDVSPPMAMAMDDNALGDFMDTGLLGMDGDDDPVARLKRIIADREPETLQVLQNWIEEPPAKAVS